MRFFYTLLPGLLLVWIWYLATLFGFYFDAIFIVGVMWMGMWIAWLATMHAIWKSEIILLKEIRNISYTREENNIGMNGYETSDDYVILVIDKCPILALASGNGEYTPLILEKKPLAAMISRSTVKENMIDSCTYSLTEELRMWVKKNLDTEH